MEPDIRVIRLSKFLANRKATQAMNLNDVLQKLEFLKAAAHTADIPQLPQTLAEIIKDVEALNVETKEIIQLKEVIKPVWFLKVVVDIDLELTHFPNKSTRYKVLKVKVH